MARLVSHPTIDFGSVHRSSHRARLGLETPVIVYHRPRRTASIAGVRVLRSETSRFRFPAVGHATRLPARRPALPFGLPRARRA